MHSLYVDSTSGLTVGLLNQAYEWLSYLEIDHKKPSEVIHLEILNLLEANNVELKNCKFFFNSGPGSYTGMRLGEGLAQVFEWDNLPVFSFHHFEVPRLLEISKGYWVTSAFKGQIFLYEWDLSSDTSLQSLIDQSQFSIQDPKLGYTLSQNEELYKELKSTKELIHLEAKKLFTKIESLKLRVPPFYFRTIDEEFKRA